MPFGICAGGLEIVVRAARSVRRDRRHRSVVAATSITRIVE
jgi:hypothetical protein